MWCGPANREPDQANPYFEILRSQHCGSRSTVADSAAIWSRIRGDCMFRCDNLVRSRGGRAFNSCRRGETLLSPRVWHLVRRYDRRGKCERESYTRGGELIPLCFRLCCDGIFWRYIGGSAAGRLVQLIVYTFCGYLCRHALVGLAILAHHCSTLGVQVQQSVEFPK